MTDIKQINIKVNNAHIAVVHTEGKTEPEIDRDIARAVRKVIASQKSDEPVVQVKSSKGVTTITQMLILRGESIRIVLDRAFTWIDTEIEVAQEIWGRNSEDDELALEMINESIDAAEEMVNAISKDHFCPDCLEYLQGQLTHVKKCRDEFVESLKECGYEIKPPADRDEQCGDAKGVTIQ